MAARRRSNTSITQQSDDPLPRWASDLLKGRTIRRLMDNYRCAWPPADGIGLFESAAAMFESRAATRAERKKHTAALNRLLERFDVPDIRGPISSAISVCEGHLYLVSIDGPGEVPSSRADRRLLDRTERRDLQALRTLIAQGCKAPTRELLGPIWPLGEPQWKRDPWPSIDQMRARDARMRGEDAPPTVRRPASLPLSVKLPKWLRNLFSPAPFDMVYRAVYEAQTPRAQPGIRSVSRLRARDAKIRLSTPGRHFFRKPCPLRTLTKFCSKCHTGSASLQSLMEFYRVHDGGLLFQPTTGDEHDAHLNWYGLDDQDHAVDLMRYYMEGLDPDGTQLRNLCDVMGCDLDRALCLAQIDAWFFVVPLTGKNAGTVFRFSAHSERMTEFAPSVERALAAIADKICTLSSEFGPTHKLGDERRGAVSELRLVAIKSIPDKPIQGIAGSTSRREVPTSHTPRSATTPRRAPRRSPPAAR
jgi:hypothetical protein